MPGVRRDDIRVSVHGDQVSISAKPETPGEKTEGNDATKKGAVLARQLTIQQARCGGIASSSCCFGHF